MKPFFVFLAIVIAVYAIYYAVVIWQDLHKKPKEAKSTSESFDVKDMVADEESVTVSENDGGFTVGDNMYEASSVPSPPMTPPEKSAAPAAGMSKLEKLQSAFADTMDDIQPAFSDARNADELNNILIAGGMCADGRRRINVETVQGKI